MPETAMHKHNSPMLRQNDVGSTRQFFVEWPVDRKAIPKAMAQKTHALTSFLDRRIRRIASYRVDPFRKDLPLAAEEPGYYRAKRPDRKERSR